MATAEITISSTVSGLPEGGGDYGSYNLTNTSAAVFQTLLGVTTVLANAAGVSLPSSGKFLLFIPPSTNTFAWRLAQSTLDTGILMSSQGPAFLGLPGNTSVYIYTTQGTTFVMRVLAF